MDLVEPFPLDTVQKKFLMIMVNYFSKYVDAESLVHITKYVIMKLFVAKHRMLVLYNSTANIR